MPLAASGPSDGPPPAPEAAEFSASGDGAGRPVAQLRRTLAQSRGPAPSPMPPAAETSPPPPVPLINLRDLRPQTPTEVVDWAVERLGLNRAEVVARAKAMLPKGSPRDAETLTTVWLALVDSAHPPVGPAPSESGPPGPESDMAPSEPGPSAPPPLEPGPPEPAESDAPTPSEPPPLELREPPGPESEQPESPESLLLQLKEAFPGAELVTVDEDDR